MKATGEVMSIDRNFESALLKAVRSLEIGVNRLYLEKFSTYDNEKILRELKKINDERIFVVAEVLRRGLLSVEEIFDITKINQWFIQKIKNKSTGFRIIFLSNLQLCIFQCRTI